MRNKAKTTKMGKEAEAEEEQEEGDDDDDDDDDDDGGGGGGGGGGYDDGSGGGDAAGIGVGVGWLVDGGDGSAMIVTVGVMERQQRYIPSLTGLRFSVI